MVFIPRNYDAGRGVLVAGAASLAAVKYNAAVDNGSGFLTNASSSTAVDVPFVENETITLSGTAGEMVQCIRTGGKVIFDATTDAAPAQTDVGTYADLASAATVNPDASTNDLFYIESIVGATADLLVRGWFVEGVPNS